jgi:CheY-like chemotaxis protein
MTALVGGIRQVGRASQRAPVRHVRPLDRRSRRPAMIAMLTSGSHTGDVARCRELEIDAYLTKPIRGPNYARRSFASCAVRLKDCRQARP